ncbi:uncharacterized protein LOC107646692 [Arachis ipaensis]|uniref:uncharacterized protein LOC107646692 n=1 Tax=Arachis ipaensis TaxID=130454 RepID=UPI0007AFC17B|nr:uncharacterized protein LOC107646692 [Arachis ipaensis]
MNIYEWCDNYIKANININNDLKCQGIFVYGNPVFQKRRKLWQELTISNMNKEEPQAYMGDFNDILSQDEKVGVHPQPKNCLETFRKFVDDNGLMDVDSSDHCALILETQPRGRIKKEFKFEAFWADHEECKEVIRNSWQQDEGNRNCWNQFIRKRNRCKRELIEWSRRKFKRADKEIERMKTELHKIQEADLMDRDQGREKELKIKISELWKQEEKYWGLRSRLKWLKWGDRNTAFFHASTIQRRIRNRIDRVKDGTGRWIQGEANIMRLVERHYTELFVSEGERNMEECVKDIPRRVTREMNEELMANINEEEIKEAAFSMGGLKAPGPDGLNGLFFQQHWDILSKDICALVKQIFEDGVIPEDLGKTTVVLIPKVSRPESLNQLRPISCCNFVYKIVTRVLVGRLSKVLDLIISPVQSAFVKGRLIQDNIVIMQEAFHKLNRKGNLGSQDLAIKLDMNKAYDRLEWSFLQRVMEEFGFSSEWVRLVMSCVKSATYRFKINGNLSTKIYPQRGLRQGDPLSLYLFILVAESFTVLMEKAMSDKLISGIKLAPSAPVITHLLFADDCIIFAGAQEEEIYQPIQILNKYTEASGQRINTEKSGLIFGNQVSIQKRVNIEEITGMASWEDLGRYLGLPARWGRSKNKALEWIKEKILDKMQGWKEKLLNQAGKEVLIKAVIQAIPTYAMNVIKFPKSFCKSIEAAIARFWWTNNGKERSIHWKGWSNLTKCKLNGGLGFKDVECQNIAHLAKQAWRLLKEEDAIWAKTLKAIYYPNCSLWDAEEGRNASWIWKSLLEGRDFLRRRGRWSVGSGTEIDIWKDNWVMGMNKLGRHGEGQPRRVSELIKEGEGWDANRIQELFSENIADLIKRIPISLINKKDHFVWPDRLDGQYLVKSGYYSAKVEKDTKEEIKQSKASTSQNVREVWETIWGLPVPQKVKMIFWKAAHNILPVNVNLYQRRCAVKPSCTICQAENETVEHALLLCPWTRVVWFGSSLQIAPTANNVSSFEKWMMDTVRKIKSGTGKEQDRILCKLGSVCWCIWKARNQHIYQQIRINPKQAIINAEQLATDYHNTTRSRSTDNTSRADRSGERKRITWRPPPQNRLKANTDAAFHRESGIAAAAVVVRDWQGKIITGTTSRFITNSAIAAEAQAYREALILIRNLQMDNCLIETDCLPLVQAIKARMPIAEADAIIRDIFQLLDETPDVGATWTPREGNSVAHQLAAMAAGNEIRRQWIFDPPNQIRNTIRIEAGFATHQHNQQIHKQLKGVSGPTNHQGYQSENGLPEREEMDLPETVENRNMQEDVGGEQLQPSASRRPNTEGVNRIGETWRAGRVGSTEGPGPMRDAARQRVTKAETYWPEFPRRIHQQRRQHRAGEEKRVDRRWRDVPLQRGTEVTKREECFSLQIHASARPGKEDPTMTATPNREGREEDDIVVGSGTRESG